MSTYRKAKWRKELKNLRQQPQESIEAYSTRYYELWHYLDPFNHHEESDRVEEFIEGLHNEFLIQVQSIMPTTVTQARDKARAVEIAFSIKKSRDNKFNFKEKSTQKKLNEKRQNFQKES